MNEALTIAGASGQRRRRHRRRVAAEQPRHLGAVGVQHVLGLVDEPEPVQTSAGLQHGPPEQSQRPHATDAGVVVA